MKVGDLVEVSDEALRDMFSRMEMEMPIGDVTWKMPGLVATADEKTPAKWVTVFWPIESPWRGMSAHDPKDLTVVCSK
jgi:hypothetical protein